MKKSTIEIEFNPDSRLLLRAGWLAHEFLKTFKQDLGGVSLKPTRKANSFILRVDEKEIWDLRLDGDLPRMKELKQLVREAILSDPHHAQIEFNV